MSIQMTFADVRAQLRDAVGVPEAALKAARSHVDQLAAEVYPLVDQQVRGVWLTPPQRSLVYYGLHVLAVERHPELFQRLLKLLRLPEDELAVLFVERPELTLPQMLLGVWDGNAKTLFHMLEHADLSAPARWALFDLVARLTFDQRIPREETVAFLTNFAATPLADPDDLVWWAWQDAVCRLGIVDLKPALEGVWTFAVNAEETDVTRAERVACLATLEHAALDPTDASTFDEAGLQPMTDVVAAFAWLYERHAMLQRLDAEQAAEAQAAEFAPDPGLNDEEFDWLAGFLESRQSGDVAMSIEGLDGFLTAVTIGPAAPSLDECLPEIFGQALGGTLPEWHDDEQRLYFMSALAKRRDAIARLAAGNAAFDPIVGPYVEDERGLDWADGFATGATMHDAAWETIFASTRAGEAMYRIFDLAPPSAKDDVVLTGDARRQRLSELPALLNVIAMFWRDPKAAIPALDQPVRSTKVGRNDPCPCGSGKKYKKCHGAGGAANGGGPLLH